MLNKISYFTFELQSQKKISFVTPVYKGEPFLKELVAQLTKVALGLNLQYEIILINDESPDNSWQIIQSLSKNNSNIKALNLLKNIGQHFSILEGLKIVQGDYIVVLDCDLQDDPYSIPSLFKELKPNNYVLAKRKTRKSSWMEIISSFLFYQVLHLIKGVKINSKTVNFGVYNRQLIRDILNNQSSFRYFPLAVATHGNNKVEVNITHQKRSIGESGYRLMDRIKLAAFILSSKKIKKSAIIQGSINV